METPLTRQNRPDYFEPKIVELYRHLFHVSPPNDDLEESVPTEGFWREFFLLKPDKQKLHDILEPLTTDDLLQIQVYTRLFFRRAIEEAGSGISPCNENALEHLAGFLSAVLNKRYVSPSTEIIEVLAGLDAIDRLITDLVSGLEMIIRHSTVELFRRKAVITALAMVSGSYQTTLVTYFIHRDLFPALMKYVNEATESTPDVLVLLGLLANYNRFEAQNLYHNRLEDFVNEKTILRLVNTFAEVCNSITDRYVTVQDDSPTPWSLSSTLSMVGLRALTPESSRPAPPSEDEVKILFGVLPNVEASAILSAYSFIHANKIFASLLVSKPTTQDRHDFPLAQFLSSTSYLCHHAHRSSRASKYAVLSLLMLLLLSDDPILVKRLSSTDNRMTVRLARQRAPLLPYIDKPRIPTTVIIDICSDTINHNLRKRLDPSLYGATIQILIRLISSLEAAKTRLQYHWSHLWASLFALLRFLTQYSSDLTASSIAYLIRNEICTPLTSLLAFCLSRGDNFLPDPASYDDLFYKLIESSALLPKFKSAYVQTASTTKATSTQITNSIKTDLSSSTTPTNILLIATNALIAVSSHYQNLLTSKSKQHQSPATVQKIIREGYETLPDIGSSPSTTQTASKVIDFGHWEKWRESSWKSEIKKILREIVEDATRGVCLS